MRLFKDFRLAAPELRKGCQDWIRGAVDRFSVVLRNRHTAAPERIGDGPHDCALSSLFWAVPVLPETEIISAFNVATDNWPYGGVTNKEFAIALSHLGVGSSYSTEINRLDELLATRPARCVALVRGHFISIVDGVIAGRDATHPWPPETHLYCHWTFNRQWFRRGQGSRRKRAGTS